MYTPEWLSKPAELLLDEWEQRREPYDVVIVGSGYGGSVAAARLASCATKEFDNDRRLTVCVLERGREHVPGTFPDNFSELPGHVRCSRFDDPVASGPHDGLFDVRIGKDVSVLVANGLGGGSLINAGVAERPDADVFEKDWPASIQTEWKDQSLDRYYREALKELGANPAQVDEPEEGDQALLKYRSFSNSVSDLNPRPATITVAYSKDKDESPHAVQHAKCKNCGDCATGCNVGAKKTLSTNYLRKAFAHGAAIYTGVTVSHVAKRGDEWEVVVALTTPARPLEQQPRRSIRARHVILAAGTLGSTEILMRSKALTRLTLSDCLGARFSTNGDMISAMYKRGERVNASPLESSRLDERHVGPTITGIARAGTKRENRIVIEELAIPGALRRVFEEIVTTSALLERFGRFDDTTHWPLSKHDPKAKRGVRALPADPLAIDHEVILGCQLFASMGNDGAKGRLQLVPDWHYGANARQVHNGAIRIHWPNAGNENVFKVQDRSFRAIAKEGGWTYLPSPLWQPLPLDFSKALSGEKPAGLLLSVHPLGGCAMADDAGHGVVDHMGRVFCGRTGAEFHQGLLVLDGSIIPTALGINPLLTITALAERAIERYIAIQQWASLKDPVQKIEPPPKIDPAPTREPVTAIQFSERMIGRLQLGPKGAPSDAELLIKFHEIRNLASFLQEPRHALQFDGTLRFTAQDGSADPRQTDVIGSAELFVRGGRGFFARILKALWAYARTRALADLFGRPGAFGGRNLQEFFKGIIGYLALASNVGEVRYMFYEFTLVSEVFDAAGNKLPPGTVFTGRKTLEYAKGANPWRQLLDLDLKAAIPERNRPMNVGTLSADMAFLLEGFASPLQILKQRDLPAAWLDLASLGLFLARMMLKIHFWDFRLPKYQKYDPGRDTRRLPSALEPLHMERHVVGPTAQAGTEPFLLLTRYRRGKQAAGKPVLLIHGLGSGGIQFATPRVNPNLAQYLAGEGFDIWVAEMRTSIALPSSVHQWTLDQVACGDIPRLVDVVLEQTGEEQIDVVAHCIGSLMFCAAALDGRLQQPSGESKIRRAALMQVGPLLELSKGTRLRALAIAPLLRVLPEGFVDFSVDDRADWVQSAIDRVLSTYPYPADEARYHRLGLFDNPHIANCNRWAAIDGLMIRHRNLSEEMLDNLGEVLGHSNITTWAQPIQAGLLGRLTNSEGTNAYLTTENVRERFRFPVLFLHGSDNDVFDPLTSFKSAELLRRVHGDDFPVRVEILEGYRHIDPLIGCNAATDVFPPIAKFLNDEIVVRDAAPDARPKGYYFRRPLIGPLVGWLRQDDENRWLARIWCRLDDQRSPVSFAVVWVQTKGHDPQPFIIDQVHHDVASNEDPLIAGPMDTILWVDVALDKGAGDYDITVLSAHEDAAASVPSDYVEAERRAGKRASTREPHIPPEPRVAWEAKLSAPAACENYLRLVRKPYREGAYDEKIDTATVEIPKSSASDVLTFAVASCRYPGWLVDRRLADAAFGALRERLSAKDGRPAALFLIGDQIYADATAGLFDPKSQRERFYEAYREAWTAPNARDVLSHLPVYMMMDDHEAGDDWHPDDVLSEEQRTLRQQGLQAFRQYQWRHSPGNRPRDPRTVPPGAFWYDFTLQGFPVFVCDTRSGRSGRDRILDEAQFLEMTRWLTGLQDREDPAAADRPKIIVSPAVVVPFRKRLNPNGTAECPTRSDGWDGFPSQLRELFCFIAAKRITNVVFLCGDSHLSMRTDIWFDVDRGQPFRATCIMASPMYGPYPFVNTSADEFVLDTRECRLTLPGVGSMYYQASKPVAGNGFTLTRVWRDKDGAWQIDSEVLPDHAARPGLTADIAVAGV